MKRLASRWRRRVEELKNPDAKLRQRLPYEKRGAMIAAINICLSELEQTIAENERDDSTDDA